MTDRTKPASPEHEALYQELCAVALKYEKDGTPPIEIIAVVSNMLGKLLGAMDPKDYTAAGLMAYVGQNIEMGNAQFITNRAMGKI